MIDPNALLDAAIALHDSLPEAKGKWYNMNDDMKKRYIQRAQCVIETYMAQAEEN